MIYPILFEPIYKEMPWGGGRLNSMYGKKSPFDHTGESWDISCRPKEMGIVKNGVYCGLRFQDLVNLDRLNWLGQNIAHANHFPLLVKLIDACDNLSVQVHPDDIFAGNHENDSSGKTEIWYVMEAPAEGHIILGIKEGISRDAFLQALEDKNAEDCLHKLPVKKGDVVHVPAGLVHALTRGIIVAEIQQNSDLTYRIYDYNRLGLAGKPRELHVEKAMAVSDFDNKIKKTTIFGLRVSKKGAELTYYLATPHFAVVKYNIQKDLTEKTDGLKFYIFTCVEGEGTLEGSWGEVALTAGDSVFVPAGLGAYILTGETTLIKSWVPNITEDFVQPLTAAGYNSAAISQLL